MNTSGTHVAKVLIVTDSRHGATREIGARVQRVLTATGLQADHFDASKIEQLGGYDAAVLGSAVYVGRWLPDLKRLIAENAQTLSLTPVWLFESGPLGDPPKPADPSEDLGTIQRQLAASVRVFPGRLDRAQLGRGERIVARIVHSPYGDFRPFDEVEAWAASIAASIQSGSLSESHTP